MKKTIYEKPSIQVVICSQEPLMTASLTGDKTDPDTPASSSTPTLSNGWVFEEEEMDN